MKKTIIAALLCTQLAWAQQVNPAPNTVITNTAQPTITVTFNMPIRSARVLIDGRDFTGSAKIQGNVLTLVPPYPLDNGVHRVQAESVSIVGIPESANWSFTLGTAAQAPVPPAAVAGVPGNFNPPADQITRERRPTISAEFPEPVTNARATLDNRDVTNQALLSGRTVQIPLAQDLEPGTHQVSIQATGPSGQTRVANWAFVVRGARTMALGNLNPPPNARLKQSRPYVAADFPAPVTNVRVLVDNQDLTQQAEISGQRVAWHPNYDMAAGPHNVMIEGRTANGQLIQGNWTFYLDVPAQTVTPPPPPTREADEVSVDEPVAGDRVSEIFDVSGHATPGAPVRVTVRNLPKQTKKVTFKGKADRAGYYQIPVSVKWAPRGTKLELEVAETTAKGQIVGEPYVLEVIRK